MKLNNLTKCIFAVLVLANNAVNAEDQYPAANFEPKVVFQDESVAKSSENSTTSKSSSSASSSTNNSDSQYPASNFQPKVVYSDSDYKHTAPSVSSSNSSNSESLSSVETSMSSEAVAEKSDSSMGYLLGLVALAVGGFVFFKKGAKKTVAAMKSSAVDYANRAGGATGVARYIMRASGTGVSRYIDKNVKISEPAAPVSGVEKYLASRSTEAQSSSSQSATGVEKYLRNKG